MISEFKDEWKHLRAKQASDIIVPLVAQLTDREVRRLHQCFVEFGGYYSDEETLAEMYRLCKATISKRGLTE